MKKIAVLILICFVSVFGQETGSMSGRVTDKKTGEPLLGVNIVFKGTYYGAVTDINGSYRVKNVNAGTYYVEISFIGYKTVQFTSTKIVSGANKVLDVQMEESMLALGTDIVVIGEKPMMDVEETQSKRSFNKDDIANAKLADIGAIVTQQAGVVATDNEIHIRGGRSNENAFCSMVCPYRIRWREPVSVYSFLLTLLKKLKLSPVVIMPNTDKRLPAL